MLVKVVSNKKKVWNEFWVLTPMQYFYLFFPTTMICCSFSTEKRRKVFSDSLNLWGAQGWDLLPAVSSLFYLLLVQTSSDVPFDLAPSFFLDHYKWYASLPQGYPSSRTRYRFQDLGADWLCANAILFIWSQTNEFILLSSAEITQLSSHPKLRQRQHGK